MNFGRRVIIYRTFEFIGRMCFGVVTTPHQDMAAQTEPGSV